MAQAENQANHREIRVLRNDRMREQIFRGISAVADAVEFLHAAPICHPPIYLFDGDEELLMEPHVAATHLVETYYLRPAG